MTRFRTIPLAAVILLAGALAACAGEPPSPAADAPDASTQGASAVEEPEVDYEPAYPEEVSSEDLSEADAAQQETHSHDDGTTHSHGDEDADDHGQDDGSHSH